ncbi:dimethylarginine dimethylaminohydrolase family protein [Pararhizobium mangrovi]|uniref:arginine deiminase n=1 Tax=Pararhizobium mangrovi TaxID=2590452 RepID=A0A506UH19_9HYPH|nr:arginine deiminase family protein [Pararhizobium mangrovi]TPW31977.1 amidinotransferase [Pararhizobium mangrovi]
MSEANIPLQARREGGGTPLMKDWHPSSEVGVLTDVLLGPAESFHWMGEENAAWSSLVRDTMRKGLTFDKQLAMRQYREMVSAYEDAGVACHYLPIDEQTPYQIYARDSSFITPYGAVICQLANPRRRGEYAAALRFYLEHGIPIYDMVSAGNFEGGDFNIIAEKTALVGYTDHRSEEVAARQVARWFEQEGWEIKFAPIDQFYVHIDLMVCMLNEACAAVCLETTPDDIVEWIRSKGIEIIPASFRETMSLGCNVVSLGRDRVLSTAGATDLNAKMKAAGFTVYDPEMTMFTQAGGGVHCMCQPLNREAA